MKPRRGLKGSGTHGARIGIHARELQATFEVEGEPFRAYNTIHHWFVWTIRRDHRFCKTKLGRVEQGKDGLLYTPNKDTVCGESLLRQAVEKMKVPWPIFVSTVTKAILGIQEIRRVLDE